MCINNALEQTLVGVRGYRSAREERFVCVVLFHQADCSLLNIRAGQPLSSIRVRRFQSIRTTAPEWECRHLYTHETFIQIESYFNLWRMTKVPGIEAADNGKSYK